MRGETLWRASSILSMKIMREKESSGAETGGGGPEPLRVPPGPPMILPAADVKSGRKETNPPP